MEWMLHCMHNNRRDELSRVYNVPIWCLCRCKGQQNKLTRRVGGWCGRTTRRSTPGSHCWSLQAEQCTAYSMFTRPFAPCVIQARFVQTVPFALFDLVMVCVQPCPTLSVNTSINTVQPVKFLCSMGLSSPHAVSLCPELAYSCCLFNHHSSLPACFFTLPCRWICLTRS